jgi:hypothetical protein
VDGIDELRFKVDAKVFQILVQWKKATFVKHLRMVFELEWIRGE